MPMFTKSSLKILIALILGSATSVTAIVLMTFGIGQFNVIRIVGQEQSTFWFSVALGLVNLSLIILNPIGGIFLDKKKSLLGNRSVLIILGSILGFVFMQCFAFSRNMFELIAFWFLSSLSYGIVSLTYYVLIPENFNKSDYGKASGVVSSSVPLIIMLITMVVMGGGSELSLHHKITLISSFQLAFNLISFWILRNLTNKNTGKEPQKIETNSSYFYPKFKEHPNYTWTLLSRLCINFVSTGLSMMTLFYITRFHLDSKHVYEIHAITSLGVILMVGSGMSSGYLCDRFNLKKSLLVFSSILTAVCMFIYSSANIILLVIVVSFIHQFAFGIFNSVNMTLVNLALPSKGNYAKDIAIMNNTNYIAKSLVSFLTPFILLLGKELMNDDGFTLFFLVLASVSLLSVVFISKIKLI